MPPTAPWHPHLHDAPPQLAGRLRVRPEEPRRCPRGCRRRTTEDLLDSYKLCGARSSPSSAKLRTCFSSSPQPSSVTACIFTLNAVWPDGVRFQTPTMSRSSRSPANIVAGLATVAFRWVSDKVKERHHAVPRRSGCRRGSASSSTARPRTHRVFCSLGLVAFTVRVALLLSRIIPAGREGGLRPLRHDRPRRVLHGPRHVRPLLMIGKRMTPQARTYWGILGIIV